jgi:hypothetical protein
MWPASTASLALRFPFRFPLLRAAALATVVSGAPGCLFFGRGDDGPPPIQTPVATSGAAAPWTVEVGPGHDTWVAVAENDEVGKTHGFQGGYHVATSVRVGVDLATTTFEKNGVSIELEVSGPGGELISRAVDFAPPRSTPEGVVLQDLRAYVDGDTSGPVIVRVTVVEQGTGRWAKGEKRVVVR